MNSTVDIPLQRVYVRNEFLGSNLTGLTPGYWHSVTSVPARAFTCHVVLDNGAHWAGIPIHAIVTKPDASAIDLSVAQSYDCFSYDVQVVRHTFLRDQLVSCLKTKVKGRYLFTIHSVDPLGKAPFAEFPEQYKTFTFIETEAGNIIARPNNYIRWIDPALYDTTEKVPAYERIKEIYRSEK